MCDASCPGGVYRAEEAVVTALRNGTGNSQIWMIDGAAAWGREGFFSALAAAFGFPAYFGHNWDATYDCLTDRASGAGGCGVLLILRGQAWMNSLGAAQWETGRRVFSDAARFWMEQGRCFLVVVESAEAVPNIPGLPSECLAHIQTCMSERDSIIAADEEIRQLHRAGHYDDALHLAEELVRQYPASGHAVFVLAGVHDFQDREDVAAGFYRQALELGLDGDELQRSYVQFGSTLRNVGLFQEAVILLREGAERYPADAAIKAFLALALFSAGEERDALATALGVLSDHAEQVDLRGYDRALSEYIAALRAET